MEMTKLQTPVFAAYTAHLEVFSCLVTRRALIPTHGACKGGLLINKVHGSPSTI
jgi:hypothetical protein